MHFAMIGAVALVWLTSSPVLAQVQSKDIAARHGHGVGVNRPGAESTQPVTISAVATQWTVGTRLPSPRIGDKAETGDYLKCAYAALAVGRNGLARQSLEMAETRSLGGPMQKGSTTVPGDVPKVFRIRDALHALGGGDRKQAIEFIKIAMLN